jgi:hypothetical protein
MNTPRERDITRPIHLVTPLPPCVLWALTRGLGWDYSCMNLEEAYVADIRVHSRFFKLLKACFCGSL